MSTAYHYLREPVTALHVDADSTTHAHITVFVDHKAAGVLVVCPDSLPDMLRMFADSDEAIVSYAEHGNVVFRAQFPLDKIKPELQLVSEYGDLITIAQLLARHNENV